MGIEDKVIFTGTFENEEKFYLYRNALFVAAPSLYGEAQNIAATEAMAYGKPVIVSETGGMTETFRK